MTKTLRAYLLDPASATLKPIDLPPDIDDRLPALYSLMECQSIDALSLPDELTAFIDDEGMFAAHPAIWTVSDKPGTPYVGRAVIVSHDDEGATASCEAPPEKIAELFTVFRCMATPELATITPSFPGELGAFVMGTRVGSFTLSLEKTPVRLAS